eukprot:TRINITY_DN33497_c0_g1_i1.p1 TRINITY_DN33497_c0_g1~~TRINITY_DN33497_c0_g1_i1.p1  ORF type:complete len:900 (-),score=91.89 TRINITY_DN33497_c0_g1_i1:59-2758(-)
MGRERDVAVIDEEQAAETNKQFTSTWTCPSSTSANPPMRNSASPLATMPLDAVISPSPSPPCNASIVPVCGPTSSRGRASPTLARSSASSSKALGQHSNQSQHPVVGASTVPSGQEKQTGSATDDEMVHLEQELATSHFIIAELERKLQDTLERGVKAGSLEARGACGRCIEASSLTRSSITASPLDRELASDASTTTTWFGARTPPPLPCASSLSIPMAASVVFAADTSSVVTTSSVAVTPSGSPVVAESALSRCRHSAPNLRASAFQHRCSCGPPILHGAETGRPLSPLKISDRLPSTPLTVVRPSSTLRSTRSVVRSSSPLRFSREVARSPVPLPLTSEALRPSTLTRATSEALRPTTPTSQQHPLCPAPVAFATVSRPLSPQAPVSRRCMISPRRDVISPRWDELPRVGSGIVPSKSLPARLFQKDLVRGHVDARSHGTLLECTIRTLSPLKASTNSGTLFPKDVPLATPASGSPPTLLRGGSQPIHSKVPVPVPGGLASHGLPSAAVLPKRSLVEPQPSSNSSLKRLYSYPSTPGWQRHFEQPSDGGVDAVASRSNSRNVRGAVRRHSASPLGDVSLVSITSRGGGPHLPVTNGGGNCGEVTAIRVAREISPLAVRPLFRGSVPIALPVPSTIAPVTGIGELAGAVVATGGAAQPSLAGSPAQQGGRGGGGLQHSGSAGLAFPFAAVQSGCGNSLLGRRCSVSPRREPIMIPHDQLRPVAPLPNAAASKVATTTTVGSAMQQPGRVSVAQATPCTSTVTVTRNCVSAPRGESSSRNIACAGAASVGTPHTEAYVLKVRGTCEASPGKARPGIGVDCLRRGSADVNSSASPHPRDISADPRVQAMELAVSPNPTEAAGKADADWYDYVQYWRSIGGDTLRKLGVPHEGVRNVGLV